MRPCIVVALACGCGRIGFGVTGDGAAAHDGSGDGVTTAATCPTFATFCDGFESGNLAAWSGSAVSPGATLVVQSSIVHTGHYALEGMVPPSMTSGLAADANEDFPTQSSGIIAVREWVYTTHPLVSYQAVLSLLDVSSAARDYVDINGAANDTWTATEGDASGGALADDASTIAIAQSTWTCLELDVALGTTLGSTLAVYVADQPVVKAMIVTPSPTYASLTAGLERSDTSGGTVYADDVVLAAQHIGCQ